MLNVFAVSGSTATKRKTKMSKNVKVLGKSVGLIPLILLFVLGVGGIGATLYTLYQASVVGEMMITVRGVDMTTIKAKETLTAGGSATEPYATSTPADKLYVQAQGGVTISPLTPTTAGDPIKKNVFLTLKSQTMNGNLIKMKISAFRADGTTPLNAGDWTATVNYVQFGAGTWNSQLYTDIAILGSLTGTNNEYTLSSTDFGKWTYAPSEATQPTTSKDGNALLITVTVNDIFNVYTQGSGWLFGGATPANEAQNAVVKIDVTTGTA